MSPKQRWRKLKENGFVRSVTVLAGGTAFAQGLMVLVLPILTRLYSPEDFSVLAVYFGLLMTISSVACLRLDIAVAMPESEQDAANLLALALLFAAITSGLLALPMVFAADEVATGLLATPRLRPYLWFLPVGVLLVASYSALQYWYTRKKGFVLIAKTRMTQAIAGAGTMVGLGWLGFTPLGLILGQTIFNGAGLAVLICRAMVADRRDSSNNISVVEMHRLLRAYHRFPKYSALETFANNAAIQLPVIMIAATAAGPEAGLLALAMRVMQAPMGLIGAAIGQVYLSRAPEQYRAGALGTFTASIIGGLLKTGVGPLCFVGIIAPDVFVIVFGEEWRRAGVLVGWMTPWFIFQLLASPISMALHVTNHQKLALALQVFGLAMRVGFVLAAATVATTRISEAYAVSGMLFYMVYLTLLMVVVSSSAGDLINQAKQGFPYIVTWCLAALLCLSLIRVMTNTLL